MTTPDASVRLGVFLTHPIQYWSPVLRGVAQDPGIDMCVYYLSDHSVTGGFDQGFGRAVKWDTPVLDGYQYRFLKNRSKTVARSGFWQYRAQDLAAEFRAKQFEAVLVPGYGFYFYLQVIALANFYGVPVLLRGDNKDAAGKRSTYKSLVRSGLLRTLYRGISGCVATSRAMQEHFRAHGVPDSRLDWSPHCIDTPCFEVATEDHARLRESIRRRLGISRDEVVVTFVGRLLDWKDPYTLVRGFARLPELLRDTARLLLVGSGPCEDDVRKLCDELIPGRYCMPGFANQTELPALYAASDLFVLPSARGYESWGLVVNEAMTAGLPVLLSDGVGCRGDLVNEGENGGVFTAGDIAGLATLLERWVGDSDLRERGGKASERLIGDYSLQVAIDGLRRAIHRVADK